MPASFWGPDRLLIQRPDGWRVLAWLDAAPLAAGGGTAVPEPNGRRLAILQDGRVRVDAGDPLAAPEEVREIAWDGPGALLAVCGHFALEPPLNPGPSLLPVPVSGCTAQRFGSYPAEGMELWRLPLSGGGGYRSGRPPPTGWNACFVPSRCPNLAWPSIATASRSTAACPPSASGWCPVRAKCATWLRTSPAAYAA